MNSTHETTVFRIESIEPHPNADRLSIVRPFGYPSIISNAEFSIGDLAAFIPPDNCVPLDRPEFSFLKNSRIRATKIRGIVSQGLVVKAPVGSVEGQDVAELFGIVHWNPPEPKVHAVNPPRAKYKGLDLPIVSPEYDLESYRKCRFRIDPAETVIVTEKLHGCNARFTFDGETVYCGSHYHWLRDDSMWHVALSYNPKLEQVMRSNPGVVFYGELVGDVKDFTYGHGKRYGIYIFDAMVDGQWLDWDDVKSMVQDSMVPVLYRGPAHLVSLELAEGKSTLDGLTQREGIVIQPERARTDVYGYVKFKVVGEQYLLTK